MNSSSKLLALFDRVIAASGLIASFVFKNDDGTIKKDYLLLFISVAFIFFLSSLYETGSKAEKRTIRALVYILVVPAAVIVISYILINPSGDAGVVFGFSAFLITVLYWVLMGFIYHDNVDIEQEES